MKKFNAIKSFGNLRRGRQGGRRGFTFVELMIAMSIMTFVLSIFGYLQLASLRQSRLQTMLIRTHSDASSAMERVRPILMSARFGSIVVSNGGTQVNFNDPWLGPATVSELRYDAGARRLMYHRDVMVDAPVPLVLSPLADVRFELFNTDSVLAATVTTSASFHGEERPFVLEKRFRIRSF